MSLLNISNTNNSLYNPFSGGGGNGIISNAIDPVFKMEFFKSENGGYIVGITYNNTCKLYTIKEIENLGREIQNILFIEVLKKHHD